MKVVRHSKTGRPYLTIKTLKVKIHGDWIACVIYLCLYLNKDGMFWIRLEDDFKQNFK